VYRAGFSAEAHDYHIVFEGPDGEVHEMYFKGKEDKKGKWITAGEQMRAWLEDPKQGGHEQVEILSKEMIVVPEPKDHALNIVRQEVEGIIAACARKMNCEVRDMHISIILSGPGNFREKIAKQRPYKGNRKDTHKPYHYQAIRDYLTGRWDARVVSGREADDECSILGHAAWNADDQFVVATIDKDLDQIPGMHYDYRQKVFYNVDQFNAEKAFWVQALAGDATDNIPGCYKIGMEKADKIIQKVIDESNEPWPPPKEFWDAIVEQYKLSKERKGCPYAEGDAVEVAIETARLVYMQKKERELWVPPGMPEAWLEDGDD
jgi:hypothetical protein